MKKLKNILLLSILMLYLIIVSGTIADSRKQMLCNDLNVIIKEKSKTGFLSSEDIIAIVNSRKQIPGTLLNEIKLKEIEHSLLKSPAIKSAQCYLTGDGKLNINVMYRDPVLRIINHNNQGYYLDIEGNIFPLSKHFSPNVLIANGNIHEPFDIKKTKNIFEISSDGVSQSRRTLYDLLVLMNYISKNEFWRSQIEQIYVNDKYEFELIPRVGAHIILFGRVNNYEEKLNNLKTLYLEGFNKSGWNDYVLINLKFKDQIICIKR